MPFLALRTAEGVGLALPVHIGYAMEDPPPCCAAEGVGFEPTVSFTPRSISSRVP